ncbi:MAG: hypothetical protein U1C52_00615 [Patescibacteria group bacterium]|nr:hypothetical protein [Patescibacteria group bacterium]
MGIHTSGKTTIGQRLNSLGLPYYPEIGNELIQTVDFSSPEIVEWFDREIMQRELQRDNLFLSEGVEAAVVETWHVGNIAYAQIRTPSVANTYKALLKKQISKHNPLFLFLDISEATFRQRAGKPVPLGIEEDQFVFYQTIKNNILSISREYDIGYYTINANQDTEKVTQDICQIMRDHEISFRKPVA